MSKLLTKWDATCLVVLTVKLSINTFLSNISLKKDPLSKNQTYKDVFICSVCNWIKVFRHDDSLNNQSGEVRSWNLLELLWAVVVGWSGDSQAVNSPQQELLKPEEDENNLPVRCVQPFWAVCIKPSSWMNEEENNSLIQLEREKRQTGCFRSQGPVFLGSFQRTESRYSGNWAELGIISSLHPWHEVMVRPVKGSGPFHVLWRRAGGVPGHSNCHFLYRRPTSLLFSHFL